MSQPRGGAAAQRKKPRPVRGGALAFRIVGELLVTAGVLVALFTGWQQWFNNIVVGDGLHEESLHQSSVWQGNASTSAPGSDPDTDPEPSGEPPVIAAPADGEVFGLMLVPRFGSDYYVPIAEGTGTVAVLNKGQIGHYTTTSMPGAVGNFAVAAHRTTYGASFNGLSKLRAGDHIYIETADGWYQYGYRNLEYVRPTGVGVLAPVPQSDGAKPGDRILTMTSCNPLYSAAERIVAYSVFEDFFPRADGPPDEIAATVAGGA